MSGNVRKNILPVAAITNCNRAASFLPKSSGNASASTVRGHLLDAADHLLQAVRTALNRNMNVPAGHRYPTHLGTLLGELIEAAPADHLQEIGGNRHRRLRKAAPGVGVEPRVRPRSRRIPVVSLHVLPVATSAEAARVAGQPTAVRPPGNGVTRGVGPPVLSRRFASLNIGRSFAYAVPGVSLRSTSGVCSLMQCPTVTVKPHHERPWDESRNAGRIPGKRALPISRAPLAQRRQQAGHVVGQRRFQVQRLARARVHEPEARRVQCLPPHQHLIVVRFAARQLL